MPRPSGMRITVGVVVVLTALRVAEVAIGMPEQVGALVVSAVLAPVVAVGLVGVRDGSVRALLGRAPGRFRRAILVGGLGVCGVQIGAHLLALGTLAGLGEPASLRLVGENPATKSTAPDQVIVFLVFGVVVAAGGEELLFRGVLIDSLLDRWSFWRANAGQALLFGVWHLAWPLTIALSDVPAPIPLVGFSIGFVTVTAVVGGLYAVFRRATGTLWTPVLAHALHNLTAVFVHVQTPADATAGSLIAAGQVLGYVALAWGVWFVAGRPG